MKTLSMPYPVILISISLLGCTVQPLQRTVTHEVDNVRVTSHRDNDDLLTAGLGADGLRSAAPPALADPAQPSPADLRRRAIWSNWRGIADLSAGGGYGEAYGSLAPVPGREFHALRTVPGASQPHRVMVQIPDSFDHAARCVVVSASSGSRGIYGAIALAGAWGLPHGCAVAYTDKGAGTDYFDVATGTGVALDGTRSAGPDLAFSPRVSEGSGASPVLSKHAHSGDNPEADWGRHVKQAAQYALEILNRSYPMQAPFTFANTRVIAVGVSNGGGAVLRASEDEEPWLDGVVAISPNIYLASGRPLFDYATEAGLLAPCALQAPEFAQAPFAGVGVLNVASAQARCNNLQAAGLLSAGTPSAQATEALAILRAKGWSDGALRAAALSTAFDVWRAVGVTYATAYARTGTAPMACAASYISTASDGKPMPATEAERAAWWADSSGIPPGAGLWIADGLAEASVDPGFAVARCLRGLWDGRGEMAARVIEGVQQTQAGLPRAGLPVIVVHGRDDGLIPQTFSSEPWVRAAQAQQRTVRFWSVADAQHFDGFLGLPPMTARYVPMLAYGYRALDRLWAHLREGSPLPADARIQPTLRKFENGGFTPLRVQDLALPEG
ncbi:MAG: hydrogenase [Gammaproteobacteria bacterium HGW-Gammaproteobacteria-2]|jgi:hydroxybutyrate-dimer hydrolase|nr:MAG: hydrogenase [Gammaproteobacteria bacterium HGW-Gammaproteobacteria-2]